MAQRYYVLCCDHALTCRESSIRILAERSHWLCLLITIKLTMSSIQLISTKTTTHNPTNTMRSIYFAVCHVQVTHYETGHRIVCNP